ncbi:hypothetical protein JOM56_001328 [Amanita muscaria]
MSLRSTISQPVSQSSKSPPENLAILRTQWKWAAFSQFFYTFSPLFALDDVSLIDIESDLVEGTSHVIPRITTRLLYTLTYDRKVSLENWQYILRKQYTKRAPHLNPFALRSQSGVHDNKNVAQKPPDDEDTAGHHDDASSTTSNEFNDWDRLSMLQKLDSIQLLTEWQFQNPSRLRTLMKCEDEGASWRIEPIGHDKQKNAYWLIGPDRLWIQRTHPRRPKKKRSMKQNTTNHARKDSFRDSKRRRVDENSNLDGSENHVCHSDTNRRAARTQAKVDLDVHTQTILERCQSHGRRRRAVYNSTSSVRPSGTRVSSRLRGTQQEEWQPLPQEWKEELEEKDSHPDYTSISERILKTGLETESDELSELTELSDDNDRLPPTPYPTSDHEELPNRVVLRDAPEEEPLKDFVEWETICVSSYDWEHIADRFASGTHYSEKGLHKYLIHHLVPSVTERLKATERKRRLEEAITHRKRSSRIALKESKREQVARNRAEEKEKMSRSKRLEARQQREEERRIQQDNPRELRRSERETQQRGRFLFYCVLQPAQLMSLKAEGERRIQKVSFTPAKTNLLAQAGRDLSCEICHLYDANPDDHGPLMSCGSCFKWQHIACNAKARVTTAGLLQGDWDSTDFVCQSCRTRVQISNGLLEIRAPQGGDHMNKPVSRTKTTVRDHQQSYTVTQPCSTTTCGPSWRPNATPLIDHGTSSTSHYVTQPVGPSQERQLALVMQFSLQEYLDLTACFPELPK